MVFRLIFFVMTAVLVLDSLLGRFAILTLPRFECCRFSFALILRFLVFTLATESVEIERSIALEKILSIFAAVCSLFPETAACQVSLYADNRNRRNRGRWCNGRNAKKTNTLKQTKTTPPAFCPALKCIYRIPLPGIQNVMISGTGVYVFVSARPGAVWGVFRRSGRDLSIVFFLREAPAKQIL